VRGRETLSVLKRSTSPAVFQKIVRGNAHELLRIPTYATANQRGTVTKFGDVLETGSTIAKTPKSKGILVAGARNTLHLEFPWSVAELPVAS